MDSVSCASTAHIHHDRLPNWLRRRIIKELKPSREVRSGFSCINYVRNHFGLRNVLDHVGCTDDNTFIAEPYPLNRADIQSLKLFAEKCRLRYSISGQSQHYPNRTLRITFYPPTSC